MAAAAATAHLPVGVESLSELTRIENTTQATLYVAPRDIVGCFRYAELIGQVGVAIVALLVYEYFITL